MGQGAGKDEKKKATGASKKDKEQLASKGSALPAKEVAAGGFGRANFIIDNPGKVADDYDIDRKKLGEGSYGSVSKAKHKSSGQIRALKTISKKHVKNPERFKQEVAIMKMMDHPNIVKLHESFEDHRNIYLVMELCSGGELFDRIIEAGHFTEKQAAILMQQIIRAIFYMHQNKIAHRDLKPENFLFSTKEAIDKSTNLLKIIDFGLSCKFESGKDLTTKAGTPYYVAPEVLAGKYNEASDIWSCGVIMFVMLCGYPPFYGETDAEVLSKVRLGSFNFSSNDWANVSKDAKDLIRRMLQKDPKHRATAADSVTDVWIKDKAPSAGNAPLCDVLVKNMKQFRGEHKLKRAALHIIANQLDDGKIKAMRDAFLAMDENQDGQLTVAEVRKGMFKAGFKDIPPDLEQIMKEVDSDGSGVIDYSEFLAATLDVKTYIQEENVWAAFRAFDLNGDGKISPEELNEVLKDPTVQAEFGEQMKNIDADGDGFIDFEEFMAMMRGTGTATAPSR